jgi:methylglutaconyl-CoA hydratase
MSGQDASELVHYSSTPEAAFITLDSPSSRNALSQALVDQLIKRIAQASQSSCNVVVLTHTDPVFCAGMDLKDTRSVDLSGLTQVMLALRNVPQPTMAVLTGPARAGGLGLMASCDFVVAADHVTFAFTEVRIGVVPALISVPVLARVAAPLLVTEFLTGSEFSAARAREIGLITHVSADPHGEAQRLIAQLAAVGPEALRLTTSLLREANSFQYEQRLVKLQKQSEVIFASDEAQEGMLAFREKRKPNWLKR